MYNFVFETDILHSKRILARQRYEISHCDMDRLIMRLRAHERRMFTNASELVGLLTSTGEASVALKLAGGQDEFRQAVSSLALLAWEQGFPWTLDQTEQYDVGDERFHECVRAYIADKDHPLGLNVAPIDSTDAGSLQCRA